VDQEIVLLHGFIKKTQKTPGDELELARKRMNEYVQAYEKEHPSWR
jgi:phage-related protein